MKLLCKSSQTNSNNNNETSGRKNQFSFDIHKNLLTRMQKPSKPSKALLWESNGKLSRQSLVQFDVQTSERDEERKEKLMMKLNNRLKIQRPEK